MNGRTFLAIAALGFVAHGAAYGQMYLMSKSSSVYYPCGPFEDCPLFLSDGEQGNASSQLSSRRNISADGRFVVFNSLANNLIPNGGAQARNVFVRDRRAAVTELVSAGVNGQPVGYSDDEAISPDGLFVAFTSGYPNVTAVTTSTGAQVYLRDRRGFTKLVSVDAFGMPGNADSDSPNVTSRGQFVVFSSQATNLAVGTQGVRQIYIRDVWGNTIELVSVDGYGTPGNGPSYQPAISDDGRFVVFASQATNFVPADRNGAQFDVFVRDRIARTTTLVSVDSAGVQGLGYTWFPSISTDGRFVAFEGNSNIAPECGSCVFLHDLVTGATENVSVNSAGQRAFGGNGGGGAIVSAGGRYVTFYSNAANLDGADTNGDYDVFVRDRVLGITQRTSVGINCVGINTLSCTVGSANGQSITPSISDDGSAVTFGSTASNFGLFGNSDTNQVSDVFAYQDVSRLPECGSSSYPECNGWCGYAAHCTALNVGGSSAGCVCLPDPGCGTSPYPVCDPNAACPTVDSPYYPFGQIQLRCMTGYTGCLCMDESTGDYLIPTTSTSTTSTTRPTTTSTSTTSTTRPTTTSTSPTSTTTSTSTTSTTTTSTTRPKKRTTTTTLPRR